MTVLGVDVLLAADALPSSPWLATSRYEEPIQRAGLVRHCPQAAAYAVPLYQDALFAEFRQMFFQKAEFFGIRLRPIFLTAIVLPPGRGLLRVHNRHHLGKLHLIG